MLYSALAFLAGICVFHLSAELPAATWLWLGGCVPLVFLPRPLLRAGGFAVAGFLWCWWCAGQLLDMQLPGELEGQDIRVRGQIEALPERLIDGRVRFRFLVDHFSGVNSERPSTGWQPLALSTRLTWYQGAPDLRAGERWQLRVRLKQPRGLSNPGGFDYERWLFAQRIRATGYVRASDSNQRLPSGANRYIQDLRGRVSAHIQALDIRAPAQALLRALGIGDRSAMSGSQWLVLQQTGTGHLLAISGLHVGLVAGLVFFIARKAWSLLGDAQLVPTPRMAALCSMSAALAYALLAGFQVPAQRALVMVWVWMLALVWSGRPNPWRVWSIALWLVLIMDPLAALSAGFWLSFAAVALILVQTVRRCGRRHWLLKLLGMQLGLVAGLTPFLWVWFHQISLIAPLANLLAIPWVGFLVVPLLLLGLLCLPLAPGLSGWLLGIAAALLEVLWEGLEYLAAVPGVQWQAPAVAGVWLLLLSLGVVCLLLPRALAVGMVALSLLLPVLLLKPGRPDSGGLWLTVLDVGQGLAVVLETRSHLLVYDAGPAFRSGFNSADAVIIPYLRYRGHRRVNALVISHADNDHAGGGEFLFRQLAVERIQSGEPQRIGWARSTRCEAGQQWVWDRVRFEYLRPLDGGEGNDASCVLRVETADGKVILLPGDIEKPSERALVERQSEKLRANVLIAPHHGSLTSSTPAFVTAVSPDLVLFAVGYRNRFGFPSPVIADRYRDIEADALDTARNGAIQIRLEAGKAVRVVSHRDRKQRYWMAKN
jgi:competence protein ComEC